MSPEVIDGLAYNALQNRQVLSMVIGAAIGGALGVAKGIGNEIGLRTKVKSGISNLTHQLNAGTTSAINISATDLDGAFNRTMALHRTTDTAIRAGEEVAKDRKKLDEKHGSIKRIALTSLAGAGIGGFAGFGIGGAF